MSPPADPSGAAGPYAPELRAALDAVRHASRLCRDVAPEAIHKEDRSPVTVADFGSQAVIGAALKESFGDDPILAEEASAMLREEGNESVRRQVVEAVRTQRPDATDDDVLGWIDQGHAEESSGRFWSIDPIDGTKGFLRGGQYAVALALVIDGVPQVGLLGCPRLSFSGSTAGDGGTVFVGVRGRVAAAYPIDGDAEPWPLRVTELDDPSTARICESVELRGKSHEINRRIAELLGTTATTVRLDSQAKYAGLARGDAEIYLRPEQPPGYRENIWDHAAGMCVVEAAGGRVTDTRGVPLDFLRGSKLVRNSGVLATNARLHDAVLEALSDIGGA